MSSSLSYQEKHAISKPHPDVVEALEHIQGGKALDIGCGKGRNSFYLHANGFDVTGFDSDRERIARMQHIIFTEGWQDTIRVEEHDMNLADINARFDMMVATVCFQYLTPETAKLVIRNMQEHTATGGVHVIVAPMSTPDMPCPIDFPFTFEPEMLRALYIGWEMIKYNEDLGTFHRTDENGNRLKSHFVTMIARRG